MRHLKDQVTLIIPDADHRRLWSNQSSSFSLRPITGRTRRLPPESGGCGSGRSPSSS